jgi:putative oxidoreductase
MVGLWGRLGAVLLIIFLVPDTLVLHNDWSWLGKVSLTHVSAHAEQITHCLRNLGLLGGLLMVLGFGSGGFSIDLLRQGKRKVVG